MPSHTTRILIGDVRDRLRELADESAHCIVTSPPYFNLRDYGMSAQIGLEATPDAYVAELVAVFREARRVLRSDGTLWLNLGDSYASSGGQGRQCGEQFKDRARGKEHITKAVRFNSNTLAAKQRLMIPARVALALQADRWWLRDEIIWHKPNPMPVSVTDRTTPAHEMLYMFAKSARYYYDNFAIAEPLARPEEANRKTPGKFGGANNYVEAQKQSRFHSGNEYHGTPTGTRNKRSVWVVTPKPFKQAHFATFPPDLIRPCILAGCPPSGTVIDPFFGAGTTGLVAAELGRNCIGIELNPEYAAIATQRLGLRNPLAGLAERQREHVARNAPVVALIERLRARVAA